jgi:hypothetical protein
VTPIVKFLKVVLRLEMNLLSLQSSAEQQPSITLSKLYLPRIVAKVENPARVYPLVSKQKEAYVFSNLG